MKRICATVFAAFLSVAGADALAHQFVTKKGDVPRDTMKKEPPVSCAREDLRKSAKDPMAKDGMLPKSGAKDCFDDAPMPLKPMAMDRESSRRLA